MRRYRELLQALVFLTAFFGGAFVLRTLVFGQESFPPQTMDLPREVRNYYPNPDGSCVQLAGAKVGFHNRNENWAAVPFDSRYGSAVRGGSNPSRVASYCRQRGIPIYNVTGKESCRAMMAWAAKTNRFAAIGFKWNHFCCLYGYMPGKAEPWAVVDNNIRTVDWYSDAEFTRVHLQSGPWVVIPDGPAPASPPEPTAWWE